MKKFSKLIIAIFLMSGIWSCDIQKQASKSKTDTNLNEVFEQKEYRKGDTVRYQIPAITFKDTIITRTSVQGTTQRIIYDKEGNASTECISSAIEAWIKYSRELEESKKEKQSEKTEKSNFDWLLYIVIGLVVVMMFALLLGFFYLKSLSSKITSFFDAIVNIKNNV